MLFLRKLLRLPTPVDLGWSEYNALPLREFTPDEKGHCWEDWSETVKRMHPIKFFLAETLGDFVRYKIWLRVTRPFKDAYHWFVSHYVPSRRYHFLDLRQPCNKGELKNHDCYRYGWRDVPEKMLYAWFNLLGEYLKEQPYDLTTSYTLEEINADAGMKYQHENLQEAKNIYEWWNVGRKREYQNYYDIQNQWYQLHENKEARKSGKSREMMKVLRTAEQEMENKTDEMLMRLIKIRRSLWT